MRAAALAVVTALLSLNLSVAWAQPSQPAPSQSGPQSPAVKTDSGNNSNTPVGGANSFTESEAKARIEARGYTQVGPLQKDDSGVWRGTATKGDQRLHVSVDYQGNVNAN